LVHAFRAIIALMMEAASASETSVNFYRTVWRNNPENSHLHTSSRENLKSHEGQKLSGTLDNMMKGTVLCNPCTWEKPRA
jgi:hypothetical protein